MPNDAPRVFLTGTSRNETLTAQEPLPTLLDGRGGNDRLSGNRGDDTYVWNLGDGSDFILEPSSAGDQGDDVLLFGAGISAGDLRFERDSGTLFIHVAGDRLTIFGQFINRGFIVEEAIFADGLVLSLTENLTLTGTAADEVVNSFGDDDIIALNGAGGADTLRGSTADQTLTGGTGDDRVFGGQGDDVYVWNRGDGSDLIFDAGLSIDDDVLRFGTGVVFDDLRFEMDQDNLFIHVHGDRLFLQNQYSEAAFNIETATLQDGTSFSLLSGLALKGTDADEVLTAFNVRVNSLEGAGGADTLFGSGRDDTFIWNRGDGSDVITEQRGDDVLRFGAGITAADLRFERDSENLFINIDGDRLQIVEQFDREGRNLEQAGFADGSTLSLLTDLVLTGTDDGDLITAFDNRVSVMNGLDGADTLQGSVGDQILTGGAGDDQLFGGRDEDTYVWNRGDGSDFISDNGFNTQTDTLRFGPGITFDDLRFETDQGSLLIHVAGDRLTIDKQFNDLGFRVENAVFDDGSTVSLFNNLALVGTDAAEQLTAIANRVVSLRGRGGDDTLQGSTSDDIYIWNIGDGSDVIAEISTTQDAGDDEIRFGPGIAAVDMRFERDANNLFIHVAGDRLTISNHFVARGFEVEKARFADGSTLTLTENLTLTGTDAGELVTAFDNAVIALNGQGGADTLVGSGADQILTGGAGVDHLQGGKGNDTYVWNRGDGSDIIQEDDVTGFDRGNKVLFGAGVEFEDLRFEMDQFNLFIHAHGDRMTLENQYLDGQFSVETAAFQDGSTISLLQDLHLEGTDADEQIIAFAGRVASVDGQGGADTLIGSARVDSLQGGDGNDVLLGSNGGDVLDGGQGNDLLDGGFDNDTLIAGGGVDALDAGIGDDVIRLSGSSVHTTNQFAVNISSATQVGTGVKVAVAGLTRIEAVTDGNRDTDIVQLTDQGDAFFLHDALSGFHETVTLAADYKGNQGAARFQNIEKIEGLGGNDLIDLTSPDYSLAGLDMIIDGGAGDDTLFGGAGLNVLLGGSGADVFEFTRTSVNTIVADFDEADGDVLRFFNTGGAVFDADSVQRADIGMTITFTDTANGQDQDLFIPLAFSPSEFTTSLDDLLGAVEVV